MFTLALHSFFLGPRSLSAICRLCFLQHLFANRCLKDRPNVIDLLPFIGSNDDELDDLDLMTDPLQEGGDDGGGLRQGPITRAIFRHLEEKKKSELLVQIKMLTILNFEDSCKNCEK